MKLTLKETVVFSMLGCLMFISKIIMEALPNMHLLGVLIVTFTITFRAKTLYSIYVYVFLVGLVYGFTPWWVPNLYTWTVLWGAVMLVPKKLPKIGFYAVCIGLCAAHGYLYGTLCAPANALLTGLNLRGMLAWIVSGIAFDLIHGTSNLILGLLIPPLSYGLKTAKKYL